ncbi:MAG: hypothetical protein WB706_02380 [Nitrososphaeraceae archaeon]
MIRNSKHDAEIVLCWSALEEIIMLDMHNMNVQKEDVELLINGR